MAFIRSATVIRHDTSGTTTEVVQKSDSGPEGKRKVSRPLRPLEKAQRRVLKAQKVFSDEMLRRHEKSAHKKRDGFLREGAKNQVGALRRAVKKLV
jgi:hypothetical protein